MLNLDENLKFGQKFRIWTKILNLESKFSSKFWMKILNLAENFKFG